MIGQPLNKRIREDFEDRRWKKISKYQLHNILNISPLYDVFIWTFNLLSNITEWFSFEYKRKEA